jgi:hypothetical protein
MERYSSDVILLNLSPSSELACDVDVSPVYSFSFIPSWGVCKWQTSPSWPVHPSGCNRLQREIVPEVALRNLKQEILHRGESRLAGVLDNDTKSDTEEGL